ncbi:MAG: STM4015 family protein [Verrucomicrobiales bacterium]|nr:STM4015 family protein [Verrucomicrobiales bacterium]
MIPEKLTTWLGYPVESWIPSQDPPDYANKIYRLGYDWNHEVPLRDSMTAFFAGDGVEESPGLILGAPDESADTFGDEVDFLVQHKAKLPKLRALFLGEMDQEESEISWIENGAMTPVIESFPGLEELRIRGGMGLTWEPCRHICLKKLVIETGGIGTDVLQGILGSIMPELEHLEIWLGTEGYGWEGSEADVKPFLYNNPFPKLKYLGLKNCDHEDEIAKLAADAPVLDHLEVLDLSGGALKDEGGAALLASEKVKKLNFLDLHHHFMSDEMMEKFDASGMHVDLSDQEEADEYGDETYYYVAVGE